MTELVPQHSDRVTCLRELELLLSNTLADFLVSATKLD